MKKLTVGSSVFGPYAQIETLSDRYRCDHADLPFSVVGEGVISDWEGELPQPSTPVPETVSPRQIRQALTRAGLRASVEAAVAAGDQDTKDWYEFATVFERNNHVVAALGQALSVSDTQLDDLWRLAATL